MIHALIFAGGSGTRMKSEDLPKQFIDIDGKPIIIRTLEHFSSHILVDEIVIVCLESWIGYLEQLLKDYSIGKVVSIVSGGRNGFESIHNGLMKLREFSSEDDIVLICDGVRPILSAQLIDDCIQNTQLYETAVPVTPSIDSVLLSEDGLQCSRNISRKFVYITQAPQGYRMAKVLWAHAEAERQGRTDTVSTADLMIELGENIHLFPGERNNIKVTTPEDLLSLRSNYYYEHYKRFAKEELKYGL